MRVCCSVLLFVTLYCSSKLSIPCACVAVCCSVLQCVALCCTLKHSIRCARVAVCCSVLQCAALRCSLKHSIRCETSCSWALHHYILGAAQVSCVYTQLFFACLCTGQKTCTTSRQIFLQGDLRRAEDIVMKCPRTRCLASNRKIFVHVETNIFTRVLRRVEHTQKRPTHNTTTNTRTGFVCLSLVFVHYKRPATRRGKK